MIDRDAVLAVADVLAAEMFYSDHHANIYRAIRALFSEGNPVDILTVSERMRKHGTLDAAGGSVYLVELTNAVASAANIEYHARIIAQKHIRRGVIQAATTAIESAHDETLDDFTALEEAEKNLFQVWNSFNSSSAKQLGAPALEALKLAERATVSNGLTGVPSGLTTVDRITGGWQKSDLIIIAARPGMGKTSLAMNMAYSAARDFGKAVAVFSLEMSADQLAMRLVCAETGLDSQAIRGGRVSGDDLARFAAAAEKMNSVPVYIDDTPGISIFQMRASMRRLKARYDIELVVVDYLQLMSGERGRNQNRDQEIGQITQGLKALAKEMRIPVIALSQLSRENEKRGGGKRPLLSDLRESGNIEQDADIVALIHRPEYYGVLEDEEGNSTRGIAEIIFAKHRHGKLGTERLLWTDKTTTFSDIIAPPAGVLVDYSTPPVVSAHPPASARPNLDNDDIPF